MRKLNIFLSPKNNKKHSTAKSQQRYSKFVYFQVLKRGLCFIIFHSISASGHFPNIFLFLLLYFNSSFVQFPKILSN